MTAYPVDFDYNSRDGFHQAGFASNENEALRVAQERVFFDTRYWKNVRVEIATKEVGATCRSRTEFESHWKAEIEAGWVQPIQVTGGWRGEATYWAATAEEVVKD